MTAAGGPLRAESFPKRRCQFEFIAAKPYLNPREGRSSLFVKTRHHTRLGCGEISLAGFPRGSPYETAAGRVFLRSEPVNGGLLIIIIASMRYRRGRPVKASRCESCRQPECMTNGMNLTRQSRIVGATRGAPAME